MFRPGAGTRTARARAASGRDSPVAESRPPRAPCVARAPEPDATPRRACGCVCALGSCAVCPRTAPRTNTRESTTPPTWTSPLSRVSHHASQCGPSAPTSVARVATARQTALRLTHHCSVSRSLRGHTHHSHHAHSTLKRHASNMTPPFGSGSPLLSTEGARLPREAPQLDVARTPLLALPVTYP